MAVPQACQPLGPARLASPVKQKLRTFQAAGNVAAATWFNDVRLAAASATDRATALGLGIASAPGLAPHAPRIPTATNKLQSSSLR